ncbi:hypothetical protein P1A145kb_p180 [Pectobacterium phage DU_PP_I]|nr:hypothetical protein P1A145kb_p180 [Pectobacterium phage DU_PP_I]ATS93897.1 hypothetical protein P12B145kb_p181 [Pectobacterium phage DU_PP_IV]
MNSLSIKGYLNGFHELPCPPQKVTTGDTYIVGSYLYAWDGRQWNGLGSMTDPKAEQELTYRGVKVTLWSEHDITELFLDPDNLDMDDLAIFETTYPEDYKAFEELWSDLRAKQLASNELNEWRDKYAKDIRGDNP